MARWGFVGVAALAAIIAVFVSLRSTSQEPPRQIVQGRNNSVLFITDSHYGFCNNHLATSLTLLENHPDVEVHYASFPKLKSKVERMTQLGRARNPKARPITWHELPEPDYVDAIAPRRGDVDGLIVAPGLRGLEELLVMLESAIDPWSPQEHYDLYLAMQQVIREVDPALVVADFFLDPAVEATRMLNRSAAMVAPNDLNMLLVHMQPWGGMFWKYPGMGTGETFPLPLRDLPTHLYILYKYIKAMVFAPVFTEKRAFLASKGIKDPLKMDPISFTDMPWISSAFPEGGYPLDYIPPHVVPCGAIAVDAGPIGEQDAALARWLARAPTVLINLGSGFYYSKERATIMGESLLPALEQTDVQVLWKLHREKKYDDFDDNFAPSLKKYIDNGRLRIERWLDADPFSILTSGHIVLSVHHGGASSYHETMLAGVPHIILPLWADTYDFAGMAEYLGVGIWPGKDVTPDWSTTALADAFLQALKGEKGVEMRQKAEALGKIAASYGGRQTAANVVASLAAQGYA